MGVPRGQDERSGAGAFGAGPGAWGKRSGRAVGRTELWRSRWGWGAGGLRDAGTLGFYSEPGRVWEGSQQGGRHAFCCKDHYDHDNGTRQATSGPVV